MQRGSRAVPEMRVLVIDDDQVTHDQVTTALRPPLADQVLGARTPGDGIRAALEHAPDVILLDINMPEMDGFKVCRLLKENERTRDIPVLFLTVDRNMVHLARAFDCGATDYIRKPVNGVELQARVRVAMRQRQIVSLLKEQARVDALTGLMNRASLDDALKAAASAHERTGAPASLMMLDVDHFKQINDRYGHGVGDEVLRAIGRTMRACCRPYDTPSRFGGDEFAVVFGQVEGADARSAADRLLTALREMVVIDGDHTLRCTLSGGLATTAGVSGLFDPAELLKAADGSLYRAKKAGRGRLVVGALRQEG